MQLELLRIAAAAVFLTVSAASFGQASNSSGGGMLITPGSPTAPNVGIGASSSASREVPIGGLSKCENLLGDEKEKCIRDERSSTGSRAPVSTGTAGSQMTPPSGSTR